MGNAMVFLEKLTEFIVYLFDIILESDVTLENPIKTKLWNDLVCNVMTVGKKYIMSLFESASLVVTPNGTKASKLYAIKPTDGSGDLSVVRATTATVRA